MSYQKILVDNTTCSRRFHLTFDDEATPVPSVEVRCLLCNEVVFAATEHPPVQLARDENLVKTSVLSDHLTTACAFEDALSRKTIPSYAQGTGTNSQVQPPIVQPQRTGGVGGPGNNA